MEVFLRAREKLFLITTLKAYIYANLFFHKPRCFQFLSADLTQIELATTHYNALWMNDYEYIF